MNGVIQEFEEKVVRNDFPQFNVGDTVKVSIKIVEGEKERVQALQGTVIARKGKGVSETFSLYRISYGVGMERVFYVHSPRLVSLEVVKRNETRRAKLYYLRGLKGKSAKLVEKIGSGTSENEKRAAKTDTAAAS